MLKKTASSGPPRRCARKSVLFEKMYDCTHLSKILDLKLNINVIYNIYTNLVMKYRI